MANHMFNPRPLPLHTLARAHTRIPPQVSLDACHLTILVRSLFPPFTRGMDITPAIFKTFSKDYRKHEITNQAFLNP